MEWIVVDLIGVLDKVAGPLAGVVVGFGLGRWLDWWHRRHRHAALWQALSAEAAFCAEKADAFLKDGFQAPLYRLPLMAYQHALPALLAEGAVKAGEHRALLAFFNTVETLNRGLDQADALWKTDRDRLQRVHERNGWKAQRLQPGGELYALACTVLHRKTRPSGLRRLTGRG